MSSSDLFISYKKNNDTFSKIKSDFYSSCSCSCCNDCSWFSDENSCATINRSWFYVARMGNSDIEKRVVKAQLTFNY